MAFDPYSGGGLLGQPAAAPVQQPGGLIPVPPPPVHQGPGLLPLIVGALGSIAGGPTFGHGFVRGLDARQRQQGAGYRDQLAYYNALQNQQEAQREAQAAEQAQAQQDQNRQRLYDLAISRGASEEEAQAVSNVGAAQAPWLKRAFAEPAEQWGPVTPIETPRGPALSQTNAATGQIRILGGGGVTVNATGAPTPPQGYQFIDPANIGAGVSPLPGGPADPMAVAQRRVQGEQLSREALREDARNVLASTQADYAAKIQAAADDPTSSSKRRDAEQAAIFVGLAQQNLRNQGRELGQGMQEKLSAPTPLQAGFNQIAETLLGRFVTAPPAESDTDLELAQPVAPVPQATVEQSTQPADPVVQFRAANPQYANATDDQVRELIELRARDQ